MILNHRGEHLKNRSEFRSDCFAQGQDGWLETGYTSRVRILGTRTGWRGGDVVEPLPLGAERNIDTSTSASRPASMRTRPSTPSVNATLATILGREAARRRTKLTLDELLHENRRLEPDLSRPESVAGPGCGRACVGLWPSMLWVTSCTYNALACHARATPVARQRRALPSTVVTVVGPTVCIAHPTRTGLLLALLPRCLPRST